MKTSLYVTFSDVENRNPYMKYGLAERELKGELLKLKRNYKIVSAKEDNTILCLTVREKTAEEKKMTLRGKASYQSRKEAARQSAIDWQNDFANHDYSWGELAEWQAHFEKLGRRYGLITEFKENGVI